MFCFNQFVLCFASLCCDFRLCIVFHIFVLRFAYPCCVLYLWVTVEESSKDETVPFRLQIEVIFKYLFIN